MTLAEAPFIKHVYGREGKQTIQAIEDFDPQPDHFKGTAPDRLPSLLKKLQGENLCVSLLFDDHYCHWDSSMETAGPALPDTMALRKTVAALKTSLAVSEAEIRKIERETKDQRNSPVWHEVRHYRITASLFGYVLRRRPDTPPTSLVLKIL